jgi:hypothetical protein
VVLVVHSAFAERNQADLRSDRMNVPSSLHIWTKATELAKVARKEGERFESADIDPGSGPRLLMQSSSLGIGFNPMFVSNPRDQCVLSHAPAR